MERWFRVGIGIAALPVLAIGAIVTLYGIAGVFLSPVEGLWILMIGLFVDLSSMLAVVLALAGGLPEWALWRGRNARDHARD